MGRRAKTASEPKGKPKKLPAKPRKKLTKKEKTLALAALEVEAPVVEDPENVPAGQDAKRLKRRDSNEQTLRALGDRLEHLPE
jgi:hypothetical protein